MSSFLYPRKIAVHRPDTNPGAGAQGYGGTIEADETLVFRELPASIQFKPGGRGGDLPADTERKANFRIFIPRKSAPLGSIAERDIIIDDLGKRYQVGAAYWNSLGHNLFCELLQM